MTDLIEFLSNPKVTIGTGGATTGTGLMALLGWIPEHLTDIAIAVGIFSTVASLAMSAHKTLLENRRTKASLKRQELESKKLKLEMDIIRRDEAARRQLDHRGVDRR